MDLFASVNNSIRNQLTGKICLLQRLYKLGARKFLVNNAPPAGCFPSSAAQSTPKGKCNEEINRGISFYNKGLPDMLHELQSQLPGFTYIFSDLYNFLMEMRENGNRYGKNKTTYSTVCLDQLHFH